MGPYEREALGELKRYVRPGVVESEWLGNAVLLYSRALDSESSGEDRSEWSRRRGIAVSDLRECPEIPNALVRLRARFMLRSAPGGWVPRIE